MPLMPSASASLMYKTTVQLRGSNCCWGLHDMYHWPISCSLYTVLVRVPLVPLCTKDKRTLLMQVLDGSSLCRSFQEAHDPLDMVQGPEVKPPSAIKVAAHQLLL